MFITIATKNNKFCYAFITKKIDRHLQLLLATS